MANPDKITVFLTLICNNAARYPQKAVVAVKNFFKGVGGLKFHTPEKSESQLSLFEVSKKYETELRELDGKYEIEYQKVDEEYKTALRELDEKYEIEGQKDNKRFKILKLIIPSFLSGIERDKEHFEMMNRKTDEKYEITHKRNIERAEIRRRRDNERAEVIRKRDNEHTEIANEIAFRKRADECRNASIMKAAHVYIQIMKQLPSTVQEEIALFLKEEVLDSSEYSQTVKDMALGVYEDFVLNKLDSLY